MRRIAFGLVALLVLAGCGGDNGDAADNIDLEPTNGNGGTDADTPDGQAPDDVPSDNTETGTGTEDDGTGNDTSNDGVEDSAVTDPDDQTTADLVDLTEAVPGTWPVGDAGTVTFSIQDQALVLDEVTAADGWEYVIDEQHAEEIEVEFRRDDEEWEIEIELEDNRRTLEVEIRRDVWDAQPGSYDLGDAGTFTFAFDGGALTLTDLTPADGWSVTEQDEEPDEIEFELRSDNREVEVEIETDDGRIEVEIDLKVVGPVEG